MSADVTAGAAGATTPSDRPGWDDGGNTSSNPPLCLSPHPTAGWRCQQTLDHPDRLHRDSAGRTWPVDSTDASRNGRVVDVHAFSPSAGDPDVCGMCGQQLGHWRHPHGYWPEGGVSGADCGCGLAVGAPQHDVTGLVPALVAYDVVSARPDA